MVMRWDPFSEALSLRDAMNRLFEQAVLRPGDSTRTAEGTSFAPAIDVQETQDGYTVRASLPGVKPDDVNIQYQQGMLTLSGETHEDTTREQGTYHIRERRHGRFSRTISLPDAVNADKAEATFEHGVLELHMPKAEETKPRRIQVQGASGQAGSTPELKSSSGNGSQAKAGTSA